MSSGKEIRDLNKIYLEAVYGQSAGQKLEKREKDDDAAGAPKQYTVTAADKKGNTPAYQGYKAGKKNVKTGKPLYKAADHLKDDKDWGYDKDGNSLNPVDIEKRKKKDDDLAGSPNVKKESYETKKKEEVLSAMKRQGRKLSDKDKEKIANKVVTSKGDTSKSDDRYAYEELNQVRKLVEKVSTVNEAKKKPSVHDDYYDPMEDPEFDPHEAEATRGQSGRGTAGKMNVRKKYPVKEGMEHNLSILSMIAEKEVKVKDTKKVVDAIRAYDKSKDASRDATYDSDEGDKEKADIEKKYAAKERGEIDKDDPNWKKRKYHTGIHGEEVEALVASGKFSNEELVKITNLQEADIADILARLEKKRISKGGDPDESPLGKETGRAMKDQQDKQRAKAKKK